MRHYTINKSVLAARIRYYMFIYLDAHGIIAAVMRSLPTIGEYIKNKTKILYV